MPKRRIDPTTGEPELTHREQRLIDELFINGGNGSRAAAAAGYGSARPGQSAYQVLRRPEVQRQIRERIAESRVSADEIIGTLASFMRGRFGGFFDQSGEFSIELAKQNGVDHLLKSISGTTRQIEATNNRPAQVVKTYRAQLHSPLQAVTILARILGIDRKSLARRQVSGDAFDQAMAADFKVGAWLEDLIDKQIKEDGLSRGAAIDELLQVRPEIAKYLQELPDAQQPSRDAKKALGLILDFLMELASNPEASPDSDPVVEASQQIDAVINAVNNDDITLEASRDAISRINARLSKQERGDLHRLQLTCLIHDNMSQSDLTLGEALNQVRQQAADLAGLQGAPSLEIVEEAIADYLASQSPASPEPQPGAVLVPSPEPQPDAVLAPSPPTHVPPPEPPHDEARILNPNPQSSSNSVPTRDSRLQTQGSKTAADVVASYRDLIEQGIRDYLTAQSAGHSIPTPDSGLQTQDSPPNLQPPPEPALKTENSKQKTALAQFDRKYARITRSYMIGLHSSFTDIIHEIARDTTLTPRQALDAMRLQGRQSTWAAPELVEPCIEEYAALDPRFWLPEPQSSSAPEHASDGPTASSTRKTYYEPPPPPLRGIDRYLRQPPPSTQSSVESQKDSITGTPKSPKLRGS